MLIVDFLSPYDFILSIRMPNYSQNTDFKLPAVKRVVLAKPLAMSSYCVMSLQSLKIHMNTADQSGMNLLVPKVQVSVVVLRQLQAPRLGNQNILATNNISYTTELNANL